MSDILFPVSGGGGGGNLDEITASAEYVKSPYTFINNEGDIEEGTMVDRENWGAAVGMNDRVTVPEGYHDGSGEVCGPTVTQRGEWTSSLGINEKVMIPEGYHNGNGYVDQDISTLGEQKVVPKLSRHTLWTANQYMTGDVIIEPIPNQKNAATKALSNGVNSQGLYFYIPEGYYLPDRTGNSWVYQTLAEVAKALGITADKVKKGVTLCGVVGTFEGWVPVATDIYYRGTIGFGGSFVRIIDQTRVDGYLTADKIYWSAYKYSRNIAFATANAVDVHKYSKIIIEGSGLSTVKFSVTGGRYSESSSGRDKWYFQDVALSNTGGTFSLIAGASHQLGIYLKLPSDCPEGYITRIRLE